MRKERVLAALRQLAPAGTPTGATAQQIAEELEIDRTNASADLNQLCQEGLASKSSGRPVQFWALPAPNKTQSGLEAFIGATGSLHGVIEQAKAAMHYPPHGLPTLITGPTGSGKSRLADAMYTYAVKCGRITPDAPYGVFNCADYASNPQLLVSQLFGHVKGAFTGAEQDHVGLVAKSEGGILFLDEVHRLPPEGQEMLFLLMDRGIYRPLGGSINQKASVTLIAATTEDPHSALLATFFRRFPVVISLPGLASRPLNERLELVERFLTEEASRIGVTISVSPIALIALLVFPTIGNIGELKSAVTLGCAKAFLDHMAREAPDATMPLHITHLSPAVQLSFFNNLEGSKEAERLIGVEERVYAPETPVSVVKNGALPYADLRRRIEGYLRSGLKPHKVQQLIQTDIEYYLQRLAKHSHTAKNSFKDLVQVVETFVNQAAEELGHPYGHEVVTSLSLHLATPSPTREAADPEKALALIAHCPKEYAVVTALKPTLEQGLGRDLSNAELAYLAMFLAAQARPRSSEGGLSVVVMAHGNSTASSLADVANQLLQTERILAIDMPLDKSVEATLDEAVQRLQAVGVGSGLLVLADMGSLTGLGPALESALAVPVAVVPLVTTAAVIEAGRLALEGETDLREVVRVVRNVYQTVDSSPAEWEDKRIIITTCLTGQGTARKLAAFLSEALPHQFRNELVIQPVDLDNTSELPRLLVEGWRGTVIAVAGTVDPHLPGVPFIGMEQILFGQGLERLTAMVSGEPVAPYREAELSQTEAIQLAVRFISESTVSIDGHQAAASAASAFEHLQTKLKQPSSPAQAARWIIHCAFTIERLKSDGPVPICSDLPFLKAHHPELLRSIQQVLKAPAAEWAIRFPEDEIGLMALILLSE